ncbi:MAG TPA: hypothetical protein PLY70_18270 [Saprospiraceae bacterium]|nr:hypothetical protein [Saprospiraceae bacterium]HPN68601.1 hypothetical protein [Saprospiraceae bacterium]
MKKLKFIVAAIALVFLGTVTVNAQVESPKPEIAKVEKQKKERNPEEMSKKRLERLKTDLNLTEDQVKKIEKSDAAFKQKLESQRAAFKKMAEDRDAEMKSILTDEQYAKHLERKKNMKGKMKERAGKRGQMHNRGQRPQQGSGGQEK